MQSWKNLFRSQFILCGTFWFLGRLLEWRGEVRQHCQFREGQQRHLRPPEQNLHRHNHPGESVVTWGKWETGICVRIGRRDETEQMKGSSSLYFNWNYVFLKIQQTTVIISPIRLSFLPAQSLFSELSWCLLGMIISKFNKVQALAGLLSKHFFSPFKKKRRWTESYPC